MMWMGVYGSGLFFQMKTFGRIEYNRDKKLGMACVLTETSSSDTLYIPLILKWIRKFIKPNMDEEFTLLWQ